MRRALTREGYVKLLGKTESYNIYLIDRIVGDWNWDIINAHLAHDDVNHIQGIPLSMRFPADVRYWWPNSDGIYTTKLGYWLGRLGHIRGWELRFGADNDAIWKLVWSMNGPLKLCHFLWRACSGSLANLGRLRDRHVWETGVCEIFHGAQESICHAIFECQNVSPHWNPSPFHSLLMDAPKNSFGELFLWMNTKLNMDELLSFCALAWAAWSFRNSVAFNNPWRCIISGALGITKLACDYKKYNAAVGGAQNSVFASHNSWQLPSVGRVKVNTNVVMIAGFGVGLGAVIRDGGGQILAVGVKRYHGEFAVKLAEAMAARWGLALAQKLGVSRVELEGDASSVITAVKQQQTGRSPFDLVIDDVKEAGSKLVSFVVSHVKRSGNVVAHFAARLVPPSGSEYVMFDLLLYLL
uniref:RNase H type-1 domain-containing protein n=1 Tax=Chenopodium quinoa TaxID=63459 RepID=A0A803MF03_CHEQI